MLVPDMDATYPNIQERISVQTLTPVKKALILSAAIAPLVLGACSSGTGETTAAEESSTTTVTADAATGEPNEEDTPAPATGEQDVEEAEQVEREAAAADNDNEEVDPGAAHHDQIGPAAAAVDPLNSGQITFAELAPVEGGEPASEAERAEIEALLNGMYDATTLHGFLGYLPANTCNELIAEQGGAAAFDLGGIPDLPMRAIPSYVEANPRIDAIEDIKVSGDTASAFVTATSGGESTTDTHRFRHEDGAWKFCN